MDIANKEAAATPTFANLLVPECLPPKSGKTVKAREAPPSDSVSGWLVGMLPLMSSMLPPSYCRTGELGESTPLGGCSRLSRLPIKLLCDLISIFL